jgi:hypothetical protein
VGEGDDERMVAAWVAIDNSGEVEGGILTADARDNYMAEMAAQLAVARKDWTRAVIVMDATSPVLALWSFMSGCDRRRQRKYRRDWLDTWLGWLHDYEAVVFIWQTSHVGAPINEWADLEAARMAEEPDGGIGGDIELQPIRYAALDLAAGGGLTAHGQIVRHGARSWSTRLLTVEVLRRLRLTSVGTQSRLPDDLDLPRLAPALEDTAEQLLARRLQLGDERRYWSPVAKELVKAAGGCPLGCGCGFSWWDVAFNCQGACVVEMRVTWLACLRDALAGLSDGVPH